MLAALADGRVDEVRVAELSAHLAACRSCMAAYADAVRYRSAWLATPRAFAPRSAMVRNGMSVVATPRAPRRSALSRRLGPALALAALAAVGGIAVWRLQPGEPPALRAALERESSRGLVLPGGEGGADREAPVQRAPSTSRDAALESAVARAARKYEEGDRSAASAYDVAAGYMLIGNLDAARDYIDEGLRAHPRDERLRILAAALQYRRSELEHAEATLRDVLRHSPGDATARLNLAIVLVDRGAHDEACALLRSVTARDAGSALARRAERVMGGPAHPCAGNGVEKPGPDRG